MIQNIIGALGSILDVISGIILAIGLGFSAMPTAIAFLISGAGMIIFSQVSVISVPSEQAILLNKISKDRNERANIILYSAIIVFLLGVTGLISIAMDYVGETILCAVMCGVGIMIFGIAIGMIKENILPALISLVSAHLTYFLTKSLIYTAAVSILSASIIFDIVNRNKLKDSPKADLSKENFKFFKPKFNFTILRGALALCTLMIGGIISDGTLTAKLAGMEANQSYLATYDGLANISSALFGGMPVGFIVSGTATAPDPLLSGIMVVVVIAILLLFKIIPRISKYIPSQSLCGFLAVLATLIILPENALTALQGNPLVASVTMLTTAFVDPFIGMTAGVVTRLILSLVGM